MSSTGLDVFDATISKANLWIKEVMQELGWEDRHKAYMGLRLTLHAVRDRLAPDDMAHFGAQLPMLLRGLYYEGWSPHRAAPLCRHQSEFLAPVRAYFQDEWRADPEDIVRAVLRVLTRHVSAGTVAHIKHLWPKALQDLWC